MSYTVGDKGTKLIGICKTGVDLVTGDPLPTPAPVPITNCTVDVRFEPPYSPSFTKQASIVDGPGGKWQYVWAAGDLTDEGEWGVKAVVTSTDGQIEQTYAGTITVDR
jgi:hypothetical protein